MTKTILVDLNNFAIAVAKNVCDRSQDGNFDEDEWIKLADETILKASETDSSTFKRVIFCCTDKRSWRRELYPEYRIRPPHRGSVKSRFPIYHIAKLAKKYANDLVEKDKSYFSLVINKAESRDIIYTISENLLKRRNNRVVCLSSNRIFLQLNRFPGFHLIDPRDLTELKDPEIDIKNLIQIISGRPEDQIRGIKLGVGPNTAKKLIESPNPTLDEWLEYADRRKRFCINRTLIILDYLPDSIKKEIYSKLGNILHY